MLAPVQVPEAGGALSLYTNVGVRLPFNESPALALKQTKISISYSPGSASQMPLEVEAPMDSPIDVAVAIRVYGI